VRWKRLRSEIDAHIEEKALDLIDSGVPEQEAWDRARREFGNATLVTESSREVWIWTWLERLWQDLAYAQRILARHAGFTAIAVVSLAMGVGANCAMFSLADALLLRPLPVPKPGDVLSVGSRQALGEARGLSMSYPDYRDLRMRSRSFAELAAFDMMHVRFAMRSEAQVELRNSFIVSDNFFAAMGVKPALGRVFQSHETEVPGRDSVMVLSDAFWKAQFGADPGVLGRTARVNGIDFTIIGVMAEEFTSADQWILPDFYIPAMMRPRLSGGKNPLEDRALRTFDVKGRLAKGVTIEQAQAEAAVLAHALASEFPDTNRSYTIEIRTELDKRLEENGPNGPIVVMLMLLAAAVLLVACANVAGLLISRAPARAREMSLRLAIGAGRTRLIRQLLTESFILALLGGVGGVAVGYAGTQFLKQMNIVADVPIALSFRLDERVLLFCVAVAIASVFLFGLWPAKRTARADLTGALRGGGSASISTSGHPRLWTRNVLVTGQVALSIVVLTVAAIMYLTFQRDLLAGPGFRTDHLLAANFDPSLVDYTDAQMHNFYRDLVERARAIPGVRSATLASGVPGGYDLETTTVIPEAYNFPAGQEGVGFVTTRADENYFATMGVTIVRGRGFTMGDNAEAPLVAVVNEAAAERHWPGQDPIGKRLRLAAGGPWREIVGVVRNMKFSFLVERPRLAMYVPFAQHPRQRTTLLLEAAGDPSPLAVPLRELVRSRDANLPVYNIRNFQDAWNTNAVKPSLLISKMIAAMGGMGVLLALSGLYGLMAYSASTRRREIALRMAIGAHKNNVLRMMLRQGFVLAVAGTGIGLLAGLATGRLMVATFPTHTPTVTAYVAVVPAVFLVTMLAAYLPARRASRVNPVAALRQD
jgi:predicted permease